MNNSLKMAPRLSYVDLSPYEQSILEHFKPKRKKPVKSLTNSDHLNILFEIQRIQNEAAKKIQRSWKWSKLIFQLRVTGFVIRMIPRIQALFRGFITRKWVATWHNHRNLVVVTIQSSVRRMMSNIRLSAEMRMEREMATRIQRIIRGKIGRSKFKNLFMFLCATRIQAMWRGIVTRITIDKEWLSDCVIPIQSLLRKRLAKEKCIKLRKDLGPISSSIQQLFRKWIANKKVAERLFEREDLYVRQTFDALSADSNFFSEELEKLALKAAKNDWERRLEDARSVILADYENISTLEKYLMQATMDMQLLSTQDILLGDIHMDAAITDIRKSITKSKCDCIFSHVLQYEDLKLDFGSAHEEIAALVEEQSRVDNWKDEDTLLNNRINNLRKSKKALKGRQRAIADERRKWQIRFYTRNGKPDRKRRPGKPWDPSAIAGPEKAVYSAGHGVDLMVNVRSSDNPVDQSRDPLECVEITTSQVALQTYLDQVKMYEAMLNPVMSIMQRGLAGNIAHASANDASSMSEESASVSFYGSRSQQGLSGSSIVRDKTRLGPIQRNLNRRRKLGLEVLDGDIGMGQVGENLGPALWRIGALPTRWEAPDIHSPYMRHSMSVAGLESSRAEAYSYLHSRSLQRLPVLSSSLKAPGSRSNNVSSKDTTTTRRTPLRSSILGQLENDPDNFLPGAGRAPTYAISLRPLKRATSVTSLNDIDDEDRGDVSLHGGENTAANALTSPIVHRRQSEIRAEVKAVEDETQRQEQFTRAKEKARSVERNRSITDSDRVLMERRRARAHDRMNREKRSTAIPWALLDELDGQRAKIESEKAYLAKQFNGKI